LRPAGRDRYNHRPRRRFGTRAMADAPTQNDLPPVRVEDFLADRQRFAGGIWQATTFAIGGLIALLVLMAIFLI
jgi:hypothetical protein